MEPTESAAPGSRLRGRRFTGAWRGSRWLTRSAERPGAEGRVAGQYTPVAGPGHAGLSLIVVDNVVREGAILDAEAPARRRSGRTRS